MKVFIIVALLLCSTVCWGAAKSTTTFPEKGIYIVELGNGKIQTFSTDDNRLKKISKVTMREDGAIMQDYLYYNGYATK